MVLWLPQIIRHLQNLPPFEIGLVTAVPYLISVVLMVSSVGIPTAPARAPPM